MNNGEYNTSLFEVTKTKTGKESAASAKHVAARVQALDAIRATARGAQAFASEKTWSHERAQAAVQHVVGKVLTEKQAEAMLAEAGRRDHDNKPVFPELRMAAKAVRDLDAAQEAKAQAKAPAAVETPPQEIEAPQISM